VRSRWKTLYMSEAPSRSRCVWSRYSRVFFGTASGMSCSGGGPVLWCSSVTSKVAVRLSILKVRAPLRLARMRVLASRPYWPKRIATTVSGHCIDATWTSPLYTRTSPPSSATATQSCVRSRLTHIRARAVTGLGRGRVKTFFPAGS
jgi:hypothetical protein